MESITLHVFNLTSLCITQLELWFDVIIQVALYSSSVCSPVPGFGFLAEWEIQGSDRDLVHSFMSEGINYFNLF